MSTIFSSLSLKTIGLNSLFLLIIILYFVGYYHLSKFFIYHINNYIKIHLGNDPLLMKNFYIISIIIKFLIFFLLLKVLIRAIYNYLLIEDDNDCELYNKTNFFAGIISITFFVIYELVMFPLYFVYGIDKIFEFIIKDINKYSGINDSTLQILNIIKKDFHNLTINDIEKILYEFYDEYYKIVNKNPSILTTIFNYFVDFLLLFVPDKYKIKEDEEDVFVIANKLGSIFGGSSIIYLIVLFMIIIYIYKNLGNGFLAIICYIFTIIIFIFIMYNIIINKLLHFSINATQVLSEKTLSGNNKLPELLKTLKIDSIKIIKDLSELHPITKMYIKKLLNSK